MIKVEKVKLSLIDGFENHPFQVNKDDSLMELADSIERNGLIEPVTLRKKKNGRFELISGHRRKLAMELKGFEEIDAFIKDLTDDEAVIEMVDSNIHRTRILPSEKAFAYKMKMDAMKHQGKASGTEFHKSGTSDNRCPKLTTEKIGKNYGESSSSVKNYIRLTNLIPELLQLVDDTVLKDKRTALTMGLKPAVELSYLNKDEQKVVYAEITYDEVTPSHSQAKKIRQLSKEKRLNFNEVEKIMTEQKGNQKEQISFNKERIEKALPSELLKRDKRYIEQYIIKAIEHYKLLEIEKENELEL